MEKITVVCPHCGSEQQESEAAVSTVCRKCKEYFSLRATSSGRRLRSQKRSRLIRCPQCESEQMVYEGALSAACTACGTHLNIGNYNLEGVVRQRLVTSGDIIFGATVRYAGPEVRGQTVRVSGKIKARIRAIQEIVLARKSEVGGTLIAPLIRVLRGAEAWADRVQTQTLEVAGNLSAKQVFAREKIDVVKEGLLQSATLIAREIRVAPGGSLSGYLDTTAAPAVDEENEESA